MVKVHRIVTNIYAADVKAAKVFYEEILGLDVLMDMSWISTYGNDAQMSVQVSVMAEGGSGTAVPDISIEVDDVAKAYELFVAAGFKIEYDMVDEPWGVKRFYVRDPFGKLVNILSHVVSTK